VAAAQAAGMPVLAVDRGRVPAGLDQATWMVKELEALTIGAAGEVVVGPGP
jgi:hypothetical protein